MGLRIEILKSATAGRRQVGILTSGRFMQFTFSFAINIWHRKAKLDTILSALDYASCRSKAEVAPALDSIALLKIRAL